MYTMIAYVFVSFCITRSLNHFLAIKLFEFFNDGFLQVESSTVCNKYSGILRVCRQFIYLAAQFSSMKSERIDDAY